jgi:large subunit ribosomal protein L35
MARGAAKGRLRAAPPACMSRPLIDPPGRYGLPRRIRTVLGRQETEMPKMKTKSGAKKRFKVTASGRVKAGQAGKRHGMIKRSNKFIRDARGTTVLSAPDEKIVKQFIPYA